MHVFCVFKKKYFPFVGLTWQFQSVQLLCLPFSVFLYCYFEVFDRLAAFAYQLSIFVVLYICAVLWDRCSKSCFHDKQSTIYLCMYLLPVFISVFVSICSSADVKLFWTFSFFFSQKMYHYHYFIFSLLQYLNMTLKPRNKLTWHHCNFAYYYRRNGEWHLNKPWMWQLSKIMR